LKYARPVSWYPFTHSHIFSMLSILNCRKTTKCYKTYCVINFIKHKLFEYTCNFLLIRHTAYGICNVSSFFIIYSYNIIVILSLYNPLYSICVICTVYLFVSIVSIISSANIYCNCLCIFVFDLVYICIIYLCLNDERLPA